jgi:hemoglobin-like flavoprotein
MNSRYVSLIQSSFAQIEPRSDKLADRFYARVFELHPELRSLFPADMQEQKAKLIAMLAFIVESLMSLDALIPALQQLGERHKGYGVLPEHYDLLGVALMWSLEQTLAADFTAETRRAWVGVYGMMANTMVLAAKYEES